MTASIQPIRQPAHPITILRAAVTWARAAGIPVGLSDRFGVVYRGPGRWEQDPSCEVISPVGAAILHTQPIAQIQSVAAAEALSAPIIWIFGMEDALEQAEPERRSPEPEQRALYAAGFEAGTLYRAEFIRAGFATVRQ